MIRSTLEQENRWKNLADALEMCPETGFRELKTSRLLGDCFANLGLKPEPFGNIPGFCATFDTGREGPVIAVLCELDALPCPKHPKADPRTGAAHCCGHHIQMAAAYGAAELIKENAGGLCGSVRFYAVPAEEGIETDFRLQLRKEGTIHFLNGKAELISRGAFEGVDIALAIHSLSVPFRVSICTSMTGIISMTVRIVGKSSHAAGAPDKGVNALDAANLGINAINALRTTFREANTVRVTPHIRYCGGGVSTVPDEVVLDIMVRANNISAMKETAQEVGRAFEGCAFALGAKAEIEQFLAYYPFAACEELNLVACEAARDMGTDYRILPPGTSSTDLGDLSTILPVIQPYLSGCEGELHSPSFHLTDSGCIADGAKLFAETVSKLLVDSGKRAYAIKQSYTPLYFGTDEFVKNTDSYYSLKE